MGKGGECYKIWCFHVTTFALLKLLNGCLLRIITPENMELCNVEGVGIGLIYFVFSSVFIAEVFFVTDAVMTISESILKSKLYSGAEPARWRA